MDTIGFLRQIACLLGCQPRNLDCQVQSVLECLCAAVGAVAAGIFWPDTAGRVQSRGQHPHDFPMAGDLLAAIDGCEQPYAFVWRLAG